MVLLLRDCVSERCKLVFSARRHASLGKQEKRYVYVVEVNKPCAFLGISASPRFASKVYVRHNFGMKTGIAARSRDNFSLYKPNAKLSRKGQQVNPGASNRVVHRERTEIARISPQSCAAILADVVRAPASHPASLRRSPDATAPADSSARARRAADRGRGWSETHSPRRNWR
jgi:hypothetical protein